MAKDTLWFPHDYNARADEKTAALINDYAATGYGVYIIITEILHEEDGSRIEYTEKKLRRLAATCKLAYDEFRKIVDDCINIYELWVLQDGWFSADRVVRNKEDRERIRKKRIEAGQRGGVANARKNVANATKKGSNARAKLEQNVANGSTGQDITVHNNSNTSSNEEDININVDWLAEKRTVLINMIKPFVEKYGKELCNDFWFYWGAPHKTLKQIRWEGEKYFDVDARLRTFKSNANKK